MAMLPQDLIPEILSRLPVKSLLRFQYVLKEWFALINGPNFLKMHLENSREHNLFVQTKQLCHCFVSVHYYLVEFSNEDQPVEVVPPFYQPYVPFNFKFKIIGCCNGLVCISTNDNIIAIWNPSIRKYKKLPFKPTAYAHGLPGRRDTFAFGYDPVNDDYKVLRIVEYFKSHERVGDEEDLAGAFEVMVYSLKANSWRIVEDEWPYKESRISSRPVFLNGVFRWLVKRAAGGIRLLAFHLTTEKFQDHTLTLPVKPHLVKSLEVLGGSLCVSAQVVGAQDFWMMKETSWSPLCTVPRTFQRVVFSTDGQKILMEMDYGLDGKNLFWYDIKKKTRRTYNCNSIGNIIWAESCVGSLLLLDGVSVD